MEIQEPESDKEHLKNAKVVFLWNFHIYTKYIYRPNIDPTETMVLKDFADNLGR